MIVVHARSACVALVLLRQVIESFDRAKSTFAYGNVPHRAKEPASSLWAGACVTNLKKTPQVSCLQSGWVQFDLALVGIGCLTNYIIQPIIVVPGVIFFSLS